jgi:biopolymer transport protein ExbB/TolQ
MSVNKLAQMLGDGCYGLLALNFFWGLYHIILGIRRLRQLSFRSHDDQQEFLDELLPQLADGQFDSAEELVADDPRAVPQLAHMAIANRNIGYEQLRQLVSEVVQRDVLADLEYRTSWVATTIKSGPLLGLMGTVLGMMAAFGRIGTGEKVEPFQIAAEISVALICTAMGLMTAIPFNFLLNSMNTRIRNFQDALGTGLVRVLDALKRQM